MLPCLCIQKITLKNIIHVYVKWSQLKTFVLKLRNKGRNKGAKLKTLRLVCEVSIYFSKAWFCGDQIKLVLLCIYYRQYGHNQAGQPIHGYFYGNDNSYSKGNISSEIKVGRMEDPTFATPVHKVQFEIAIYEIWRKGIPDYTFREQNKMVVRKRNLDLSSESKYG